MQPLTVSSPWKCREVQFKEGENTMPENGYVYAGEFYNLFPSCGGERPETDKVYREIRMILMQYNRGFCSLDETACRLTMMVRAAELFTYRNACDDLGCKG